jgi:hypothetical protein
MKINGQDIRHVEVKHLSTIPAYASGIGLVETAEGLLDCDMEVIPGRWSLQ